MPTDVDSDLDEITRIWKQITEHKLDACEAIGMVVRAIERYDPDLHDRWAPRKWLRWACPVEFGRIRNVRAAVQTYALLRAERHAAEIDGAG